MQTDILIDKNNQMPPFPSSQTQDRDLDSYNYNIDPKLIAHHPITPRDHSKLLSYNYSHRNFNHYNFFQIFNLVPPKTLFVLNNSRVIKARLKGFKWNKTKDRELTKGGHVEILLTNPFEPSSSNGLFSTLLKSNSKKREGDLFLVSNDAIIVEIKERSPSHDQNIFLCSFYSYETFTERTPLLREELFSLLEKLGEVPIPPYILNAQINSERISELNSKEVTETEYRNCFSSIDGSIALPTAGIHFTPELINLGKSLGHDFVFVTLHVGPGTFLPVKEVSIENHQMHHEYFTLGHEEKEIILKSLNSHRPIYAVGSTSLRVLESAFKFNSEKNHFESTFIFKDHSPFASTSLFLYPGKSISTISGLITNFHLPKTTLLMLVSALIGREETLYLYNEAIKNRYRFYSYGDAMIIHFNLKRNK